MPNRTLLLCGLLVLSPVTALAFGPAGHVQAAEGTWDEVSALPGNEALRGNEVARRCYLYGSIAPDVRLVPKYQADVASLVQTLEANRAVKRVRLETAEIIPMNPAFNTHDARFSLFVVERARATGSPELLAFALGGLSHGCQDREETVFAMHRYALAGRAGDVGLSAEVSGDGSQHTVAGPLELCNEAMREANQPTARVKSIRTFPTRLADGGFLGFRRAARSRALRARCWSFYHDAARAWQRQHHPQAAMISATGMLNAAGLLDVAGVALPAALGRESYGRAARIFKSRYIDLVWWADIVYWVSEVISRAFTLGTQGVADLATWVLNPCKRADAALVQRDLALENVLFARLVGGKTWKRVKERYASRAEFQRLLRGGLLDPATYGYPEVAHACTVDVARRGLQSRWVDWPYYDSRSVRGAAAQSFLIPPVPAPPARPSRWAFWKQRHYRRDLDAWHQRWDHSFEARAAGVLVADIRWIDPASGAAIAELGANDQGRAVRAQLDLRGLDPRAAWRYQGVDLDCELVVVEDSVAGADLPLARARTVVPAAQLDPTRYGELPTPTLNVDFTAPLTAGTRGYHLELRYEGQRVFTTDWEVVAAHGATTPHYVAHYGTYDRRGFASLGIAGR